MQACKRLAYFSLRRSFRWRVLNELLIQRISVSFSCSLWSNEKLIVWLSSSLPNAYTLWHRNTCIPAQTSHSHFIAVGCHWLLTFNSNKVNVQIVLFCLSRLEQSDMNVRAFESLWSSETQHGRELASYRRCDGTMPYLLFLSSSLSPFRLSVSSLSLVCNSAATDKLPQLHTSPTLSSPWGWLGILQHIRNPTVRSAFDIKFIHVFTHIDLAQQPLLFRCEPLGRQVSWQKHFCPFSLIWTV